MRFTERLKDALNSPFTAKKKVWRSIYDRSEKKHIDLERSDWPRYSDHRLNTIMGCLYKELSETNPSEFGVMNQYIHLLNHLTQLPDGCVGLELGSGVSTVVLSKLISEKGGALYSIDLSSSRIAEMLGSANFRYLCKYVRFLNGSSVKAEAVKSLYLGDTDHDIGTLTSITPSSLQCFIKEYHGNYYQLLPLGSRDDLAEICRLFFPNGNLKLPVEFLNRGKLLSEISHIEAQQVQGVVNDLVADVPMFDFMFLDSGEYSSLAEWLCLKDRVRVGGLIALHDIYFPKSAKNFLVAADVQADPRYRIIYMDQTTPQGLLIAKRLGDDLSE